MGLKCDLDSFMYMYDWGKTENMKEKEIKQTEKKETKKSENDNCT